MKIAFLLYPTHSVKVDEDSSFWIIHELLGRGHKVSLFESADMVWEAGKVRARLRTAKTHPEKGFLPSPRQKGLTPLDALDALFIRKEPPFNEEYLHALQLLLSLRDKVFILNDPAAIALTNEKLSVLDLPGFAPESFVTSDQAAAVSYIKRRGGKFVVKPLNNKAGYGIFLTDKSDKRLGPILDQVSLSGKRQMMVQRYIPHQKTGDKRILLLDGKFLGCFTRVPSPNDFRANLSLGGSMQRAVMTARDKTIVRALGPRLRKLGLYFVGLDVIGGYLSEINVTSPSGIPEIRALEGKRLEKPIADFIERSL